MTGTKDPTVFIVDDDAAVRDSIRELVESIGLLAASYCSARAFLDSFEQDSPGCLVLDVRMAETSGLELQKKLRDSGAKIPIIIITGHGDIPMAVKALRAGAVDFVQKPYRDQRLLDSINEALAIDASARQWVVRQDDLDEQLAALTPREREVYDKILDGSTTKQIAAALEISPRTVEAHRQSLLRKLEAHSVKELILRWADRNAGR